MSRKGYYVETDGVLGKMWKRIQEEKHEKMQKALLKSYCILISAEYRKLKEELGKK